MRVVPCEGRAVDLGLTDRQSRRGPAIGQIRSRATTVTDGHGRVAATRFA